MMGNMCGILEPFKTRNFGTSRGRLLRIPLITHIITHINRHSVNGVCIGDMSEELKYWALLHDQGHNDVRVLYDVRNVHCHAALRDAAIDRHKFPFIVFCHRPYGFLLSLWDTLLSLYLCGFCHIITYLERTVFVIHLTVVSPVSLLAFGRWCSLIVFNEHSARRFPLPTGQYLSHRAVLYASPNTYPYFRWSLHTAASRGLRSFSVAYSSALFDKLIHIEGVAGVAKELDHVCVR